MFFRVYLFELRVVLFPIKENRRKIEGIKLAQQRNN